MRGATCDKPLCGKALRFQSTLLMRGATSRAVERIQRIRNFNPRSSCEERRLMLRLMTLLIVFQSTLLMRGATSEHRQVERRIYFNPRSSCEERRSPPQTMTPLHNFNPRSSCEERRTCRRRLNGAVQFQSTLLMRGATAMATSRARTSLFQSTLLMRGATLHRRPS